MQETTTASAPALEQTTVAQPAPTPEQRLASLRQAHESARNERRKIESELNSMERTLQQAISTGQAGAIMKARRRKAELPDAFVEASTRERAARQAYFAALREPLIQAAQEAETALLDMQTARANKTAEFAAAFANFDAERHAIQVRLNTARLELSQFSDDEVRAEQGYHAALRRLA